MSHYRLSHLQQLEAESIHIIREVVAEFSRPVMLYSIGKDSSVMLHLARKAFHPTRIPFPLLHIDTFWKFREMIAFRDEIAKSTGVELLTRVRAKHPDVVRLLFTGYADVKAVINAINDGHVFRYITKPWEPDELLAIVHHACRRYDFVVARPRRACSVG